MGLRLWGADFAVNPSRRSAAAKLIGVGRHRWHRAIPVVSTMVAKGDSMNRSVALAISLLVVLPSFAPAKEWAKKMFQVTQHDFGHVARGSKSEFSFELQNLYEEDVHIADVRTSCGCTTPSISKSTLKTWEKGAIVATLNTRSFVGQRSSTLTVVIDKPYYAEVHLTIAGYIHSDVDFQPGVAALGEIEQGTSGQQEVTVTYRGWGNWQISDVRSANPHLEVELGSPLRQQGMVTYKMAVKLKSDAPAGIFQDQLTLVTNDQRMPTVVLPVEARVAPPLAVNPSPLMFGSLSPGQSATKQIVLTGKQPFRIVTISVDNDALQFKSAADVAKKVHLIPVTIIAPEQPGEFHYTMTIETDLASAGKTTCLVRGTVRGDSPTAATSRPLDAPIAR